MMRVAFKMALLAGVLCCGRGTDILASDHLDAPLLTGRGDLDINDLYLFQSPTNPANSVLILTVNPFAGTTSGTTFGTNDVAYEFVVDNNGDAIGDVTYIASFSDVAGGQNISLARNGVSIATGMTGAPLATAGGGTVQADLFDDPFFFDLAGFRNNFAFTGTDAFAGANVSGIVLEVPNSELGGPNIGVWARSLSGGSQVDRVGRPAVNTALIPSGKKDAFNQGMPADDQANFNTDVTAAITGLSDAANATALSAILLPDVLTFDTSMSAGFLNGRQLADDVIDAELGLLSNGAVTGDGVDMNEVAFRGVFPYLAPANVVPEPFGTALVLCALPAFYVIRRRNRV